MNNTQLDRVLKLIKRTGERCVIFDRESDSGSVLLGLDEYERFLDGGDRMSEMTEKDMLGKINRDIAMWRDQHQEFEIPERPTEWVADELEEDLEDVEAEEFLKSEENDEEEEGEESNIEVPVEPQTIPLENKETQTEGNSAAEDISDLPHDEEEEKFYLEPVE